MKYINLKLLINLIKDIAYLITYNDNYYKQWFYAVLIRKFNKKYEKYIITKYGHSYNEYEEYISLDIFKGFTTTMEDYIYGDLMSSNGKLNDKIRNDVCIFIHQTRSKIIKYAC
jgi:hypothetical protein